jgi:hypothetical protein
LSVYSQICKQNAQVILQNLCISSKVNLQNFQYIAEPDKGISDLAEKIDELSMKMYSISEELANSKRNEIIRCVADQSDKDRHHVHICILNPINDYLVVGLNH